VHSRARVEVVEYLGDEQLVHLALDDTSVASKVGIDERVEHGQEVELSIPREKLHLFDAETQERVSTF
jgi:ABC-type sugar transport system ATPase subunit